MARNRKPIRFECGHDGCREVAFYEAHSREEADRLWAKYRNGGWRCNRHTRPEEVLTRENPKRHTVLVSEENFASVGGASIGNYWGHSGFVSGPGFKAWSKDFPAGTTLIVTAEIILPEDQP